MNGQKGGRMHNRKEKKQTGWMVEIDSEQIKRKRQEMGIGKRKDEKFTGSKKDKEARQKLIQGGKKEKRKVYEG